MPAPKKKASGVRTSIRFDPPSLEEAIFAAQGLSDIIDDQAAIAASLMGLPEAEVKAASWQPNPPGPRSSRRLSVQVQTAAASDTGRGRAQSAPHSDALRACPVRSIPAQSQPRLRAHLTETPDAGAASNAQIAEVARLQPAASPVCARSRPVTAASKPRVLMALALVPVVTLLQAASSVQRRLGSSSEASAPSSNFYPARRAHCGWAPYPLQRQPCRPAPQLRQPTARPSAPLMRLRSDPVPSVPDCLAPEKARGQRAQQAPCCPKQA